MATVLKFPLAAKSRVRKESSRLDERGVFMTAAPHGMIQFSAMRPVAGELSRRELVAEITFPSYLLDRDLGLFEIETVNAAAQRLLEYLLDLHDPIESLRIVDDGGTDGGTESSKSAGSGAKSRRRKAKA